MLKPFTPIYTPMLKEGTPIDTTPPSGANVTSEEDKPQFHELSKKVIESPTIPDTHKEAYLDTVRTADKVNMNAIKKLTPLRETQLSGEEPLIPSGDEQARETGYISKSLVENVKRDPGSTLLDLLTGRKKTNIFTEMGTKVHKELENLIKRNVNVESPETQRFIDEFSNKFLIPAEKDEYRASEATFGVNIPAWKVTPEGESAEDISYPFGGTLDFVGTLKQGAMINGVDYSGRVAVVDFKTLSTMKPRFDQDMKQFVAMEEERSIRKAKQSAAGMSLYKFMIQQNPNTTYNTLKNIRKKFPENMVFMVFNPTTGHTYAYTNEELESAFKNEEWPALLDTINGLKNPEQMLEHRFGKHGPFR